MGLTRHLAGLQALGPCGAVQGRQGITFIVCRRRLARMFIVSNSLSMARINSLNSFPTNISDGTVYIYYIYLPFLNHEWRYVGEFTADGYSVSIIFRKPANPQADEPPTSKPAHDWPACRIGR